MVLMLGPRMGRAHLRLHRFRADVACLDSPSPPGRCTHHPFVCTKYGAHAPLAHFCAQNPL